MKIINLLFCILIFGFGALSAQPANDNCADAQDVILNTLYSFSTIDATTDGPLHPTAACNGNGSDSIFNDIWYRYTADFDGYVKWTLCGTIDYDSKIAVYNPGAVCPLQDGDLLICNDDGDDCGGGTESELFFPVTSGSTYILRLGGFGDATPGLEGSGSFVLLAYDPPVAPPNDNCADATPVSLGAGQPFSTIGANTDGPDHPGNSSCFGFGVTTISNDVWYSFTSPLTGTVEWSTCGTSPFDSRIAVYQAGAQCPLTDADLYVCNDDGENCPDYTSKVIIPVVEGQTYLLRLGSYDSADEGEGTFSLLEIEPPIPPENDLCTQPDSVYLITVEQADNFDVLFTGSNLHGTWEGIYPYCLATQTGGEFADVWYKFNTLGNQQIELRFNVNTVDAVFYIDLFEDCVSPIDTGIVPVACWKVGDVNSFLKDTIFGLPSDPAVFYLRVLTRLTSDISGEFWLQLVGNVISNTSEPVFPAQAIIAPNPTSGNAVLSVMLSQNVALECQLTDALGRVLQKPFSGNLSSGEHKIPMDLGHLPSGMYFLELKADGMPKTIKFIKD